MLRNLFGFPKKLYRNGRKHLRVREQLPLKWMIGTEVSGVGRVRDISTSGVLLEAKASKPFADGTVLKLESDCPTEGKFVPSEGRVVWSKPKGIFNQNLLCGIEFINPAGEIFEGLKERIESRIQSLERFDHLADIFNMTLFVIAVGLGVFVLRQQFFIQKTIEKSNHLMLGSAEKQADLYRLSNDSFQIQGLVLKELTKSYNTTKVLLVQTESLLTQSQKQNQLAQNEIVGLKTSLEQARIGNLDASTQALIGERDQLKTQLSSLKGEINLLVKNNPDLLLANSAIYEDRISGINIQMQDLKYSTLMASIKEHRKVIHQSRQRVASLKRQAHDVKVEILRQKDVLALANGNRGFLIKDGESLLSKDIHAISKKSSESQVVQKNVRINVSRFE